jgi:hypothetical protein
MDGALTGSGSALRTGFELYVFRFVSGFVMRVAFDSIIAFKIGG